MPNVISRFEFLQETYIKNEYLRASPYLTNIQKQQKKNV